MLNSCINVKGIKYEKQTKNAQNTPQLIPQGDASGRCKSAVKGEEQAEASDSAAAAAVLPDASGASAAPHKVSDKDAAASALEPVAQQAGGRDEASGAAMKSPSGVWWRALSGGFNAAAAAEASDAGSFHGSRRNFAFAEQSRRGSHSTTRSSFRQLRARAERRTDVVSQMLLSPDLLSALAQQHHGSASGGDGSAPAGAGLGRRGSIMGWVENGGGGGSADFEAGRGINPASSSSSAAKSAAQVAPEEAVGDEDRRQRGGDEDRRQRGGSSADGGRWLLRVHSGIRNAPSVPVVPEEGGADMAYALASTAPSRRASLALAETPPAPGVGGGRSRSASVVSATSSVEELVPGPAAPDAAPALASAAAGLGGSSAGGEGGVNAGVPGRRRRTRLQSQAHHHAAAGSYENLAGLDAGGSHLGPNIIEILGRALSEAEGGNREAAGPANFDSGSSLPRHSLLTMLARLSSSSLEAGHLSGGLGSVGHAARDSTSTIDAREEGGAGHGHLAEQTAALQRLERDAALGLGFDQARCHVAVVCLTSPIAYLESFLPSCSNFAASKEFAHPHSHPHSPPHSHPHSPFSLLRLFRSERFTSTNASGEEPAFNLRTIRKMTLFYFPHAHAKETNRKKKCSAAIPISTFPPASAASWNRCRFW